MWKSFTDYVAANTDKLAVAGWDALKIVLLLIAARIFIRIASRVARRLLYLKVKMEDRRRGTLASLFENVIRYTTYFILLLTVLPIFGVHIEALLAGAGVAGIAIAFGAQSLLKDFFNGLFILFEGQFDVEDYVLIGSTYGQIRSVGLRITVIKVWTGELVYIPNGQITQVTNFSKENSVAVIDVNVGYNTPPEEALQILRDVMERVKGDQSNVIGNVSVLGVQELADSAYTIRATAECEPYTHFGVIRLAKQWIRQDFAARGVDLPAQKVVYMNSSVQAGGRPVQPDYTS